MTESEAKGFIHGKLDCMNECGVFNREDINKKDLCDDCQYCYSQGNFGEQKEAFQIAINALEKQIPKKAIITGHNNAINTDVGYCPICKGVILRACDNSYCPDCGQKLDWESDEE